MSIAMHTHIYGYACFRTRLCVWLLNIPTALLLLHRPFVDGFLFCVGGRDGTGGQRCVYSCASPTGSNCYLSAYACSHACLHTRVNSECSTLPKFLYFLLILLSSI